MNNYWYGLLTPLAIILAGLTVYALAVACSRLWFAFARGPGFALRMLWRPRQERVISNWTKETHSTGGIWRTLGYDLREHVFTIERLLADPQEPVTKPLFTFFLRRGWYPTLTKQVPLVAEQIRDLQQRIRDAETTQEDKRAAEQEAREARKAQRVEAITNLIGPDYQSLYWLQGTTQFNADLDEILFIPGSDTFEDVPGHPHLRIKYPPMAIHVTTSGFPEISAYCPKDVPNTKHLSINIIDRLKAHHPHVFN